MKYIIAPVSNDLMHYGVDHLHSKTGRGSGRYAWGSGKNPRAAKREVYGGSESGVTRQKIQKLRSESRNRSGVDIQVSKYKKNISTDRGLSKRDKFSTADNVKVANEISKDNVNCALCTLAMDMRERKMDVQANTFQDWVSKGDNRDTRKSDIASWYKTKDGKSVNFAETPSFWEGGHIDKYQHILDPNYFKVGTEKKRMDSTIKSNMLKGGNGSYGHLSLEWMITDKNDPYYSYSVGGHDVFYKIEDGEVIVYDGQIGKRMPYDQYMKIQSDEGLTGYVDGFLRTDNLEFSNNDISRDTTIETDTPDKYNYSPSYKTVTKVKTNTQYSPPYVSDNKEVIQYTPPYNTVTPKKVIQNATKKVKEVGVDSSNKVKNTWDKVTTAIKNIANKATNTSPIELAKRLRNGNR